MKRKWWKDCKNRTPPFYPYVFPTLDALPVLAVRQCFWWFVTQKVADNSARQTSRNKVQSSNVWGLYFIFYACTSSPGVWVLWPRLRFSRASPRHIFWHCSMIWRGLKLLVLVYLSFEGRILVWSVVCLISFALYWLVCILLHSVLEHRTKMLMLVLAILGLNMVEQSCKNTILKIQFQGGRFGRAIRHCFHVTGRKLFVDGRFFWVSIVGTACWLQ